MEKHADVTEDRHLSFTRRVFQVAHPLVKPVLEIHIIKYIENTQMQLSKAALHKDALYLFPPFQKNTL